MFITIQAKDSKNLEKQIKETVEKIKNVNTKMGNSMYELASNSLVTENGEYKATLIFIERPLYENYREFAQSKAM